VALVLAVAAALANAVTTILERLGVESAPSEMSMHLSLLAHALRRKVWLAGFAVMALAFLLQASALHYGQLSLVQPVLTLELPFLVVILGVWFGYRLGWHEWLGAIGAAGGLAAFLFLADPRGGHLQPGLRAWAIVAFACLGACAVAVGLARIGSRTWRAAMFGTAGALAFALTAAFIKVATDYLSSDGWLGMLGHWQAYALVASGLLGVFLAQNAFHAGPVTASQSTLVIVDPLASMAIGIGLFGDRIRTAGLRGPVESVSLIVGFLSVVLLACSPLVTAMRSGNGEGPERRGP
jgi:drug/metabolite transporter (DMT)-like permease